MDILILDEDDAQRVMTAGIVRHNSLLNLGKETEANIYIAGIHHARAKYHLSQGSLSDRIQAVWFTWRAFVYASKVNLDGQKNPEHVYTLATALLRAPRWMGENKHRAVEKMIQDVLRPGGVVVDDHVRELLLIRLDESRLKRGRGMKR